MEEGPQHSVYFQIERKEESERKMAAKLAARFLLLFALLKDACFPSGFGEETEEDLLCGGLEVCR